MTLKVDATSIGRGEIASATTENGHGGNINDRAISSEGGASSSFLSSSSDGNEEEQDDERRQQDAASAVPRNGSRQQQQKVMARQNPSHKGSRFDGGLTGLVEASVSSSLDRYMADLKAPFAVTASDLGRLSEERTRAALADLLEKGVLGGTTKEEIEDVEAPSKNKQLQVDVLRLVERIRLLCPALPHPAADADRRLDDADKVKAEEQHPPTKKPTPEEEAEADLDADLAANILTSVLLRSSPESGIDPREVPHRQEVFGSNAIADKKLDGFCKLCWEAVQDFVLIMLIILGVTTILVEIFSHPGEACTTCWIEGAAILCSVCIVVLVTAGIDYAKQFAFIRLTKSLHDTNTKSVIRDAHQVTVVDDDIVVGDVLSVNSHNLASIPADCVLLGPVSDLKMDESALTGESKLIAKKPGDVVLSGTNAVQGSGKMVVIAVGTNSVAGRIRARVYESEDHEDDGLEGEDDKSPLFVKLDLLAKRIGIAGTIAAVVAFVGSCIIGLAVKDDPATEVVTYLITAITVLAVAVPEGLPLAVTLALAFSSSKMMRDQNLVKHLDACETMGCATTICTDKTGMW